MKIAITYSSITGNTKLLADSIKENINKEDLIYCGGLSKEALEADLIYVGFWTNIGKCDPKCEEFLKTIRNKKIFLFGTAGFGESEEYFLKILGRTKEFIDASNTIVGEYMCQGKMPLRVREKYEAMKASKPDMPNIDLLINNFDKALSHPDESDLKRLISKLAN